MFRNCGSYMVCGVGCCLDLFVLFGVFVFFLVCISVRVSFSLCMCVCRV